MDEKNILVTAFFPESYRSTGFGTCMRDHFDVARFGESAWKTCLGFVRHFYSVDGEISPYRPIYEDDLETLFDKDLMTKAGGLIAFFIKPDARLALPLSFRKAVNDQLELFPYLNYGGAVSVDSSFLFERFRASTLLDEETKEWLLSSYSSEGQQLAPNPISRHSYVYHENQEEQKYITDIFGAPVIDA